MRTVRIRISRSCQNACLFCDVADTLDGRPLPAGQIRAALDAAKAGGADGVVLSGGEPTLSSHLVKALAYARGIGLRTELSTNGRLLSDPERWGRLAAAGIDHVHLSLHAVDAAIHQALVGGDPIAHAQSLAALRALASAVSTTVRVVVTAHNLDEVTGVIALAADVGASVDLRFVRREGAACAHPELAVAAGAAHAALQHAMAAAEAHGVALTWCDLPRATVLTAPPPTHPAALTAQRSALLDRDVVDPALFGGLDSLPDAARAHLARRWHVAPDDVPTVLAARHLPVRGGADATPTQPWAAALPQGARVAVVVPTDVSPWLADALPAVAARLAARGVAAQTLSALPRHQPRPGPAGMLARVGGLFRRRAEVAQPTGEAWLDTLDLHDVDVVVTAGWPAAQALRARRPSLRCVVIDGDLLAGARQPLGPSDVVVSPHPTAARVYARAGVPLAQVAWAPLPVATVTVPAASEAGAILLGGGERIDTALVAAALDGLDAPVLVLPGTPTPAGATPVADDVDALAAAFARTRLLWLPCANHTVAPVGALSWALAHGRPVVTSDNATAWAWLRPGEGVAVPHDAGAHADALRTWLGDDAIHAAVDALAARAAVTSPAALADALVDGRPPHRAVALPNQPAGPFWSW